MKPWQYTPYTEDDCEEIAEIFKYLALERYSFAIEERDKEAHFRKLKHEWIEPYDREIIEHAYWIFELTRCIRLGFTAPDYAYWRKLVFMVPEE